MTLTQALVGTSLPGTVLPAGGRQPPGPLARRHLSQGGLRSESVLSVPDELRVLFPAGGLPRGATVLLAPAEPGRFPGATASGPARPCRAPGLTSLLLLLLAGASSRGHWCAVVGLPGLGLAAAAELGADLDRVVLVPRPGGNDLRPNVVSTLLETVELVFFAPEVPVRPTDARRLCTRARERSSTLVVLDAPGSAGGTGLFGGTRRSLACWPGPSDLRCAVLASSWSGLDPGHGRLSSFRLEAALAGRGAAARPRQAALQLPA